MQKSIFRKGLVLGIIVLFLGIGVQPAFAIDISNIRTSDSVNSSSLGEAQPDLIIKDIYDVNIGASLAEGLSVIIKNIGGANVKAGTLYTLRGNITRLLFGFIPLGIVATETLTFYRSTLSPGESDYCDLFSYYSPHPNKTGFYKVNVQIEITQSESNTKNNYRNEIFIGFFLGYAGDRYWNWYDLRFF